jgi:hypothetical protein
MTSTLSRFFAVLNTMGSTVTYHREEAGSVCPCVSPEGFRSPAWHKANPGEPVCNEQGRLASAITNISVKASIQPVRASQRRIGERAIELFGTVQEDDHLGFFPVEWQGATLDFTDWSDAGEDFIEYDGRRFTCVAADKLPDIDGDPNHHWECGLRLLKPTAERLT